MKAALEKIDYESRMKAEIRNPKQIRISKKEMFKTAENKTKETWRNKMRDTRNE